MVQLYLAASKYTAYKVDIDPQFLIPIFYFVPLLVGVVLHKYTPKLLSLIFGLVFTGCAAYLAYVLYLDYAIWKYVMPVVTILGGLSGTSGWFRFIVKKIKNIGDDDKFIG